MTQLTIEEYLQDQDRRLPENTFTPFSQNHALYERLKRGPLRLSELHRGLGMDTARIRDIRNKLLKPHGMTILCKVIAPGETEYRLIA